MTEDEKEIEVSILIDVLKSKTKVTLAVMKENCRMRYIVHARRIFCVIARNYLGMNLKTIAKWLNISSHASIIHNLKKHKDEIGLYAEYSNTYRDVFKGVEAVFIIKTEFNPVLIEKKIQKLTRRRNSLDNKIKMYSKRLKSLEKNINEPVNV